MPATNADTTFTFEVEGVSTRLSVARLEGVEGISELFRFELLLTSDDKLIAFSDVIGKSAVLTLSSLGDEPRYVSGIVSRFKQAEEGNKLVVFHLTLVPKAWRLQHRHDARIFQELSVPAIIEKVLKGAGLTTDDYRLALSGKYEPREYCVQYRESDLAFVSRLMEEEGIHYYFEHSDSGHVLVIADKSSSAAAIAGEETIRFRPALGAMAHGDESISLFSQTQEVRPGKVSLRDFNFKRPALSLDASSAASADDDLELYDYPGEYEMPPQGNALSKVRLEEWQTLRIVGEGTSGCVRLTPGYTFTLSEHPRDEHNARYLLTRIHHKGAQVQMGEGGGKDGPSYGNTFHCIPIAVPFRPERRTPRPTVKGVQTAIVTGPGGEEIYTDEHGRVKVHFHWDRLDKSDEKSSCWIRVSQLWAGAGWGAMWIPRIGHEVIVDFIEGDPDRPIIVGRVYHGANVPPYVLPAEKSKSVIRSNSTPGGNGANELMFEDSKGNEEIYLHAEKDWTIVVENDKTQSVGHDEKLVVDHDRDKEVKHDQSETIGNDKKIDAGGDHSEKITKTETVIVGGASTHTIGGSFAEKVGAGKVSTVGSTLTQVIGGKMTATIGGAKEESIGGDLKQGVSKDASMAITGKYQLAVSKAMTVSVTENQSTEVGKVQSTNVGDKYSLVVGDGKVTVLKNGDITIEGKQITVTASGPIKIKGSKLTVESNGSVDVKASGDVKIKGSGIAMN